MLNQESDQQLQEIGVSPRNITVRFADGPEDQVEVILPPADGFSLSNDISVPNLSMSGAPSARSTENSDLYETEFSKLRAKHARFGSSHTYLTHLARLRHLVGDLEEAKHYLNAALDNSGESFLRIELSSMLMEQNEDEKAQSILSQCNIDQDIEANLRLAYIKVRSGELQKAKVYVDRALSIDNGDYGAQMFAGAIYLSKEEWEQAVRCFRVAAEAKNYSSTLYSNLAVAYWGLGEKEKTIQTLRKAINLDPMNENAVLFLADVMFLMGSPEKCISPLEVILSYRKDSEALWARAARAFYELGKREPKDHSALKKALDALTIQSKLRDSSDVINNIGVVYSALGNTLKARRYFANAWATARQIREEDGIPFSNLLGELVTLGSYDKAFQLSKEYLESRRKNVYPRIFVHYIASMEELGKRSEAALEAERIIESNLADDDTNLNLLAYLLYNKTLIEPDSDAIMRFFPKVEELLKRCHALSNKLRCRAINNLVFALLKIGNITQAMRFLGALGRWVHNDPYVTATFGLYHLKKGNIDRAQTFYQDSILLAVGPISKERIRQRMNIEFGRFYLEQGDRILFEKYLKRALRQKKGYQYAMDESRRLLRSNRRR